MWCHTMVSQATLLLSAPIALPLTQWPTEFCNHHGLCTKYQCIEMRQIIKLVWIFNDENNEGSKDKIGIILDISCSNCAVAIKEALTRFPEGRGEQAALTTSSKESTRQCHNYSSKSRLRDLSKCD